MGFFGDAVHHPRRLFLRRALFQIHLWAGVLVSLYLVVIALSGSVLVFKDELVRWGLPRGLHVEQQGSVVPPEAMMAGFAGAVPGGVVTQLQAPTAVLPAYLLTGKDGAGRPARWFGDPASALVLPAPRTWVDTVHDLHDYLLLPPAYGMQVNGAGAAVLLLLTCTGVLLWWPGLKMWTRGLRVNLRANWRRINFDLHNAIGIWTLGIVVWWAVSGVYFGFYRQVSAAVDAVSPLRGMVAPKPAALPTPVTRSATLADVLGAAQRSSPQGRLWSVSDPSLQGKESYVLMDRAGPGNFGHRDIVCVRTADARVLSVWHYGERHTPGDWVLWSMHPLHFGTVWGFAVKVVWSALGVLLAVLTVSGVLMYWNRWLRRRWQSLRTFPAASPKVQANGVRGDPLHSPLG